MQYNKAQAHRIFVALGLLAVLAFPAIILSQSAPAGKTTLKVPPHGPSFQGKRAPNFTLRDLSGKQVSLKDYAGKPVVINFWATWCPPCLIEMPIFEELSHKYAATGLTFLGLSIDIESESASPAKIAATAKRFGITYPILLSDKHMKSLYGPVHLLPETFYVNRKGIIVEDSWGHADRAEIEKFVHEAMQ